MMFRTLLCAATIGIGSAAGAQETCTAELIQAQSEDVAAALQTIAARNPDRMQDLTATLQEQMTSIQNGGDIGQVCAFFDEVIAEAAG